MWGPLHKLQPQEQWPTRSVGRHGAMAACTCVRGGLSKRGGLTPTCGSAAPGKKEEPRAGLATLAWHRPGRYVMYGSSEVAVYLPPADITPPWATNELDLAAVDPPADGRNACR